jgi:NADH dehydrogenase FAD-containing subunit
LDVDPVTLQAKKYDNIYGLGDLVNIPITKSFWSAFHQMHVVRQNIVRAFKGQPPNAAYTSYTKAPFFIGSEKLIYFEKDKNGPGQLNMVGTGSSFLASRLFKHLKGFTGKVSNMHMGKHFGPPYGKFMPFSKYYKGKPVSRSDEVRYTPETAGKHK